MRLNKYHKEAFVKAVLQDLPQTDYDEIAQKVVQSAIVENMPEKVRAVYEEKALRHWLRADWFAMPGSLCNFYCVTGSTSWLPSDETKERLDELRQLKQEQTERWCAFKNKIEAAIGSCSTRKQALELLPEFEKYLPKDTTGTGVSNLPAICNLVAELVQAGWPKDKDAV